MCLEREDTLTFAVPHPKPEVNMPSNPAPGPKGVPFLGSLPDAWQDVLGTLTAAFRDHGEVARLRFGPYDYYLVNDPEIVKHVLVDNAKNYQKSKSYEGLRLVLGNGLVTSEGDFWRRQRKLAQPAFHKEKLQAFATTMVDSTAAMLDRWEGDAALTVDVHAEMMRLTLSIVGRTLFGKDLGADSGDAAEIGDAIRVALRHANDYAEALIKVPPWLPTPGNLRFSRAIKRLDAMVFALIEARRASGRDEQDLLSMLMSARDDADRGMTDRQLRDEVMTLVLAGHETTAVALGWTFYLLSRHPDVERRMLAEITEVLGDRLPTFDDLPRLTYTAQVLSESMRLYPPVWIFERRALAADRLGDYPIEAGATVAISPYTLHRNARFFPNPEGFDPERFGKEASAARPRTAYMPFAMGPRQCIGDAFAKMEAVLIVAAVLPKYRLSLLPGFRAEAEAKVTLRPRAGLPMRRERRAIATRPVDQHPMSAPWTA